ncbi:MAG: alpha-mannosidase [Roseiflexaceae bacterium]
MTHTIRWTAKKIAQRLALIAPLVYRRRLALPPFRFQALGGPLDPAPVRPNVDDRSWPVIAPKSYWGGWELNFVLRTDFRVPPEWDASAPVALSLSLGLTGDFNHPEALAYIDGQPYASCDRRHYEIRLPEQWRDGQSHLLALHGWTGNVAWRQADQQLFMGVSELVQIDQPTRDFIAVARVALGVSGQLDQDNPIRARLLDALDAAFRILDTREPFGEAFYASVAPATQALRAGIERAGPPLDVELFATGHAHIDVAWLWTLGQTRRKAERTFHNVLRMMEQFPDYHFTQSQPQLYDYVRRDHPALFQGIQQRVAEGRWEPIGDMWVEADCNLSGPEALARQFLLGRRFFREHFGQHATTRVLWLPDVFGYAWNLPQLIKQAGLEYFFTIKIGWNQYNQLPSDSFWWQGLDGTRVLTHFSTAAEPGVTPTYNALANPDQVIGAWKNLKQKDLRADGRTPPLLMAFGWGDGGGGPDREMLENLRELANFPGVPRVRQTDVGSFFDRLAELGDALPVWNGELYLELHRGTYTSQSRTKRNNRKSEFLLHDAELLATLAALIDPTYRYPHETLRAAWELLCLNQFHDIIPGSSIGPVYAESERQYAALRQMAGEVRDGALTAVARASGGDLLVVNPTGFRRYDLAFWPGQLAEGQRLARGDGAPLLTQPTEGGTWIAAGEWSAFNICVLAFEEGEAPQQESSLVVTPELLENDSLRVELNSDGDIVRIFDKDNQREVLPPGALANQFQAFEDRPMYWDAWDIDIYYDDRMWTAEPASAVRVVEQGPLRATIEIERRILGSRYTQRISLARNTARLDFDTTIDWRERHILLKVAFPVDILAQGATYEVQWGSVQRPTHHNTSWDWARFETCAQKWVDLSEGGYGVSLLNDCKYGHDVRGNVIRLSLLRAPTNPDPEADQGEHRFAYSLLPHAGGWNWTIVEAYALNDPLIVFPTSEARRTPADPRTVVRTNSALAVGRASLITADRTNMVIETIKQAEDGQGVIVRMYESQRRRGSVTLTTGFPLAAAWRTNLLEDNQEALEVNGSHLRLHVRPFEIITLRLVPKG